MHFGSSLLLICYAFIRNIYADGRTWLGGNASFYTAQVGASSTIAAGLCAVTLTGISWVNRPLCIAALAFYAFNAVGLWITTGDVANAVTASALLTPNNETGLFHSVSGTAATFAGNSTYHWYSLAKPDSLSYVGN